jgi:hypothetical protein
MQEKGDEALRFIKSHPGVFALRSFNRVLFYWVGNPNWLDEGHVVLRFASHSLLSLLAFLGLRLVVRTRNATAPLFAFVLMVIPLPYYITMSNTPRYRHSIEPQMVLLAVYALLSVFYYFQGREL